MHGAAAGQPHADRRDLAGGRARRVDPHPGVVGEPARPGQPELGERVDQQVLDRPHVLERTLGVGERDDRVPDELTGPVIRDVTAALDGDEVGPDRGRVAPQVGGEIGVGAVGEDVVVLEQQQVLFGAVVEQRLLHGQCFAIGHPPQPSDPQQGARRHQNSEDQSRVSSSSLTRLRKPAA